MNEAEVGAGIAASGVKRNELHITTKVWNENLAPDRLRAAMAASLEKLRIDHVDLYLIHWPSPTMNLPAALETMMALQQEGSARNIGVANFNVALLRQSIEEIRAPIAAVQFDTRPAAPAAAAALRARARLAYHGLFAARQGTAVKHPVLTRIAEKHGATPSQIAIAWLLDQPDVAPIPKSVHRERQQENLAAFDIRLDADDRAAIEALPKNQRCVNPGFAPAWDTTDNSLKLPVRRFRHPPDHHEADRRRSHHIPGRRQRRARRAISQVAMNGANPPKIAIASA